MLINEDINPNNSLYYLGAEVLKSIENKEDFDFMELYKSMNNKYNISLKLFILTIDWLFLIDAITLSEKGNLKKCF